jgi:hypothetical protein
MENYTSFGPNYPMTNWHGIFFGEACMRHYQIPKKLSNKWYNIPYILIFLKYKYTLYLQTEGVHISTKMHRLPRNLCAIKIFISDNIWCVQEYISYATVRVTRFVQQKYNREQKKKTLQFGLPIQQTTYIIIFKGYGSFLAFLINNVISFF